MIPVQTNLLLVTNDSDSGFRERGSDLDLDEEDIFKSSDSFGEQFDREDPRRAVPLGFRPVE